MWKGVNSFSACSLEARNHRGGTVFEVSLKIYKHELFGVRLPHTIKLGVIINKKICLAFLLISTLSPFMSSTNDQFTLLLSIADPPEISVENPIVYSGEGQEAMLVCIVHGESQPEVSSFMQFPELDGCVNTYRNRLSRNTKSVLCFVLFFFY